ncbi:ABC transporter ATP-binding protein [Blastococcus sp. MG754426]|nr:ABC transporter ATP-binding protein [Blastococcus sp. MG754426]MCF6511614.1 ABC transporter ATP-binding protein [Blastococcus sp. MG754427]
MLEVRDLSVDYVRDRQLVTAVAGVDLDVRAGEVVGLVGESGCGKSTLARAVVGLLPRAGGTVTLDGRPAREVGRSARPVHDRRLQMIFQDPYASLNPRRRVGRQIADGLPHSLTGPAARSARVGDLLVAVGLDPEVAGRYPHEFSGGQRQRIAIARTLAAEPSVIVADEAVSALDASTQAQVADLLLDLVRSLGMGLLFISHDLSVVRRIADRVAVMYLGRIVESGPTAQVWDRPQHPYTSALMAAVPRLGRDAELPRALTGEVPDPASPPEGCRFSTRCPRVAAPCHVDDPVLLPVGTGHLAACLLAGATGAGPDDGRPLSLTPRTLPADDRHPTRKS